MCDHFLREVNTIRQQQPQMSYVVLYVLQGDMDSSSHAVRYCRREADGRLARRRRVHYTRDGDCAANADNDAAYGGRPVHRRLPSSDDTDTELASFR